MKRKFRPQSLLLALVFALISFSSTGQIPDLVQTDGIVHPLHKANIGRIRFMNGNIPLDQLKETDFLTSFLLKPASDLNIRVFLGNSITNYLHHLAPALTEEELNKNGNYQFSFYVDGKFIYSENLHHGAGLHKSTTTTYRVPLTSTKGEDWWAIYLWNRFMQNGGEKALTEGTHQLNIELRPYLKLTELKVGELIASGELTLTVKKPKATAAEIAIQQIKPNSGWPVSKEQYHYKYIEALNKSIAEYAFKEINSIVVIKNGKLLIEEYFNGANRETLYDTRSVGKSFTSTLMGMAIRDGFIKNDTLSLKTFYPLSTFLHNSTAKENTRIKDLLTMSSAFNGSDAISESPGNEENMYPADNWVKFALDLPMDSSKTNGGQWDYFTAGVILLGDILNKSVPGGLEKYAAEKLFEHLQISKYQWQYTPQQVVNTAGGLQMSALDYAKYGQLYKNKGVWNGKQVLPATWVEKTFTRYFEIPGRPNEFYGYLFWNKTYTVAGKNYEAYYCAGNGGSKIFIFKDLPFTIVITAKAYNRAYGHPQVDKMMQDYILPAVIQ